MKKKRPRIRFNDYLLSRENALLESGRFSTAENYERARRSLHSFLRKPSLYLDQLNADTIMAYNNCLRKKGLSENSISFYNRILRAACNTARKEGYPVPKSLFDEVYTGVAPTRKRAISRSALSRILNYDAGDEKELALARDIFLFSFYARGMNFIDIAFLKKSDISGNSLYYRRHKTGQALTVWLEPCMKDIIRRYAGTGWGNYLFPLLTSEDPLACHTEYMYRLHRHNLRLKELGARCGTEVALSSYVARHSWATLAREAAIPISQISAGLGHTTEKTTAIYLDSFAPETLHRANRKLLAFIMDNKK